MLCDIYFFICCDGTTSREIYVYTFYDAHRHKSKIAVYVFYVRGREYPCGKEKLRLLLHENSNETKSS